MNGITIIEEHLCRVVDMTSLIASGILITLLCIGGLAFYRFMYKSCSKSKATKILVWYFSVAIVIMNIVFWVIQISNYNETHFEYTIEVDDSVGFNDFFDSLDV